MNTLSLDPVSPLAAHRVGILSAALLVAWVVVMTIWDLGLSQPGYWLTLVAVALLLTTVPGWLVGRAVRRSARLATRG